jgi:hypothetical protein
MRSASRNLMFSAAHLWIVDLYEHAETLYRERVHESQILDPVPGCDSK